MRIKFEERREYEANACYQFTNESLVYTRELVEKAQPKKVSGICSGGDLLFGVFAPVADTCVMIDHSMQSIKAAMIKGLLIENLTGQELKRLLDDAKVKNTDYYGATPACLLQDAIQAAVVDLPKEVKRPNALYGDGIPFAASRWGNVWSSVTAKDIDATRERLDQITIVHGDLRDLTDFGTFDLLYLSNALEHTSFDGGKPGAAFTEKVLNPGGHVLLTGAGATSLGQTFSVLNSGKVIGKHAPHHVEELLTWQYNLLQKKAPDVEAVKVT